MHIVGLNYFLGRKCLEIYISGCKEPHCPGCHNPELQIFNLEDNLEEYKEKIKIRIQTGMIDAVDILGGEPLDQPLDKLEELCLSIKSKYNIDVWIWTKYDFSTACDIMKNFIDYVDYIKTGRYIKELPSYTDKKTGIILASSNQKIIKL